jgi:hypothetical protein
MRAAGYDDWISDGRGIQQNPGLEQLKHHSIFDRIAFVGVLDAIFSPGRRHSIPPENAKHRRPKRATTVMSNFRE